MNPIAENFGHRDKITIEIPIRLRQRLEEIEKGEGLVKDGFPNELWVAILYLTNFHKTVEKHMASVKDEIKRRGELEIREESEE